MKSVALIALIGLLGCPVEARDDVHRRALAREQIQRERKLAEADFLQQDLECQQRFAVTDCVRTVEIRRREHAAKLRKQEDALNDEERLERAVQSEAALKERERDRALKDADRVKSARETPVEVTDMPRAKVRAPSPSTPVSAARKPSVQPGQAMQNRAAFDAKQKAWLERQAARERRLKQTPSGAPSTPLPVKP